MTQGRAGASSAALRWGRATVLGGMGVGLSLLAYAHFVEAEWLEVERVELSLPRLAPAFDGYTILQLSDLHIKEWLDEGYLAKIVRAANEQAPDLIALTGDYIDHPENRYAHRLSPFLSQLAAPDGVVGVLGNHDHWADPSIIRGMFAEGGVRDLSNAVYTVRRGDAALHVAGVDDVLRGEPCLDGVIERLPDEGAAILLAHEPDYARTVARAGRFDVQLSGHSHGGQVRLPYFGPLVLPRCSREHPAGLYEVGGMHLYTSRGVGLGRLHVRFRCRPEIALFTLRAAGRERGL